MLRKQTWIFAKVVVACVAVTLLVSVPAQRVVPGLSLLELCLLLLGAFVVLLLFVVSSLTLAQFVLRAGGTDTQWLWFGGDPPGLQRLRGEERAAVRREP
jgi:hypothetical protein